MMLSLILTIAMVMYFAALAIFVVMAVKTADQKYFLMFMIGFAVITIPVLNLEYLLKLTSLEADLIDQLTEDLTTAYTVMFMGPIAAIIVLMPFIVVGIWWYAGWEKSLKLMLILALMMPLPVDDKVRLIFDAIDMFWVKRLV